MDIVNNSEILVAALRRSGHHAIINWILSNINGRAVFLNNCQLKTNPFLGYRKSDSKLWGINTDAESSGKFTKKDYLVYNYEDSHLKDIFCKVFEENRDLWVGRSAKIANMIVLRDPYNNFASKLRWAYGKGKGAPSLDSIKKLPGLWKAYAYEYLGYTNFVKNKLLVNYNKWFEDKNYRLELAGQLDLPSADKGVNEVAKWGPQLWDDSFDGLKFDGQAYKMKVLERWKYFANDGYYKNLFKDKELTELSNKIFGEMSGTEILFD